jgi:protein gp37
MADTTAIEWTDHTFNPWWGCARVSPACRFCYADGLAKRYGHELWRRKGPRRMLSDANWAKPLKWNREAEQAGVPAKVFCASMADVFEDHPQVVEPRKRLWDLIERTPWLRWQLLTKRPESIADMAPWGDSWPDHVWVGVSAEDQQRADERIPILLSIPAAVRFLSCEPVLEHLDLAGYLRSDVFRCECGAWEKNGDVHPWCAECGRAWRYLPGDTRIDWVISGGESGPKARLTHPDWLRSIRDQCTEAGVPHLFKQFGEYSPYIPLVADPSRPGGQAPDWDRRAVWVDAVTGKTVKNEADVPNTGSWQAMYRVGKKAAGRRLDGEVWNQFPQEPTAVAS